MNFLNKIVEKTSPINKEPSNGKKKALVIYDGEKLVVQYENNIYDLHKYNDVVGTYDRYASPKNDYYPLWYKKVSVNSHPSHIDKVNLVWWRYKPGMKLEGVVKNNVFYPK